MRHTGWARMTSSGDVPGAKSSQYVNYDPIATSLVALATKPKALSKC